MAKERITIETRDGKCPTGVYRPDNAGAAPWPGVVVFMDGVGIRPALDPLAQRIADHGYFVILPDLFYRQGPYAPQDPAALFTNPDTRAEWFKNYLSTVTQPTVMSDTEAFLAFLAEQPDVKQSKVGVTGYCMGGGIALSAAGFFPDRVAAAASFHGARLATDEPTSPHLLASKMKAKVYVAGATEDAYFDDAQKQRLDDALTAASVDHTVLTYPAKHGWVMTDTPVHDAAQEERHFTAVFDLFDATLKT